MLIIINIKFVIFMRNIWSYLVDFNPWWKGEFLLEFKEREIYKEVRKYENSPQILAFTGLRRVGKTTLMLKILSDKIKEGADPKRMIYFSFDEFRDAGLRKILDDYEKNMGLNLRDGRYFLFFDEIQKLDDWENQLKTIYDVFGKNVKIFISGSESLFIRKRSRETLAGRIFEFFISTLSFSEFLDFCGIRRHPQQLYEKEARSALRSFVQTQGFPELADVRDKEIIKKYISESIVEKILFRDIPSMFRIRDIGSLDTTLKIIMSNPGDIIEMSGLSRDIGISRQSLSQYLNYLEKSFLVKKLYNFSRSKRTSEKRLKKFYPSIILPEITFSNDSLSKARVFEWLAVKSLNPKFFWRDAYKNEVDFVIDENGIFPVEIKSGKIDTGGTEAFMKKFRARKGFIISDDTETSLVGGDIAVIPMHKFLLSGLRT